MTEGFIQSLLYRTFSKANKYLCPNIYLFRWESDFIFVNKSLYITEIEIKLSKSDFLKEEKKAEKFQILNEGKYDFFRRKYNRETKQFYNEFVEKRDAKSPNYFYYACVNNLIKPVEIPEYAGLLSFNEDSKKSYILETVKKPKLIHKVKIEKEQITKILTSVYWKYWNHKILEKENNQKESNETCKS